VVHSRVSMIYNTSVSRTAVGPGLIHTRIRGALQLPGGCLMVQRGLCCGASPCPVAGTQVPQVPGAPYSANIQGIRERSPEELEAR